MRSATKKLLRTQGAKLKSTELKDVMAMEQRHCDQSLSILSDNKKAWAKTSINDRILILEEVKHNLMQQAEGWAEIAARQKRLPLESPLRGEEWFSGPYAVMAACNGLISTLNKMENKRFLAFLPTRQLCNDQLAVKVLPHSVWDHLLLSGIKAEVWMQSGVSELNLEAASAYDVPLEQRKGNVSLVLGAGNIAAISPLDAFHKLFVENEVVLLKLNPVNDYLFEHLQFSLKPLIDRDVLRIVRGGGAMGAYLSEHEKVDSIHITGAAVTHDAIVWGVGPEGDANRLVGKPRNKRPITSELGAVCPTIVVPGAWTAADIRYQAEQIATQKLHNSGFNCVALQTLVLPEGWSGVELLLQEVKRVMERKGKRVRYYPNTDQRIAEFSNSSKDQSGSGDGEPVCWMFEMDEGASSVHSKKEVFGPALSIKYLPCESPETYLRAAINFANDKLYGTLGANILIHPSTISEIGRNRFESILVALRYGTIAINAWTGLAFMLNACPWGGFPGATLQAPGSGIGTVHNTWMLEKTERTVIEGPWRPFPFSILAKQFSLLPRPPWFITNRRQHILGRLMTRFQCYPSIWKVPGIFINALRG